jgi:hypothetical protein
MAMFPDQHTAILVLTNSVDGGGMLRDAVFRKIVEELFEGARDLAGPELAFFVKSHHDGIAKELEQVNPHPDRAWVQRLAGVYANDDLGKVVLTAGPNGGVFDAGEWKSAFGQRKEPDGSVKLELLDAPPAGLQLVIGGDDVHPTLTLYDKQVKYVFERVRVNR